MNKSLAIALAVCAVIVAAVVAYLSFGRSAPPSSTAVPPNPQAVATPDGSEIAQPSSSPRP